MPSFSNLNDRYGGKILIRLLALLLALGCLVIPHQATGQVKPLLDNDQVRVFEATIKVGEKTPEHSHPADEATYVLSGGKIKLTLPNGTTSTAERKTGEMRWRTEPETHVAENVGDTELRFLIIQLKKPQGQQPAKEP
jgi:quercetin dioxygenase-like cupin family protein